MIYVREYGCLAPIIGETEAVTQMKRRNRFWNRLVEIETAHRLEAAKILSDVDEQVTIDQLKEKLTIIRDAIKLMRKKAHSKKVDVADLRAEAEEVKSILSVAIVNAKANRKLRVEERKEQLKALTAILWERVKVAQRQAELWWCNYDEVLTNFENARKGPKIKFHGFRGEGKVTIRYQQGLDAKAVLDGDDSRLQIRALTPEEIAASSSKNPKARHIVSIRVGSVGRAPLWFRLPVVLHRSFDIERERQSMVRTEPVKLMIRSASVKREVIGGKPRYKLLITIDNGEDAAVPTGDRVCAIDIGWRVTPDGLRVAYWVGSDGCHGELVLNESILFEFKKVHDLQSIIDRRFDEIKAYIQDRLKHGEFNALTDELRKEIGNIGQWKSPGRLYVWYRRVKSTEFQVFQDAELEAWMIKQRHLYEWVSSLRDQVLKRRREAYRLFASQITKTYDRIIIEKFDLREVTEKVSPESTREDGYAGGYRFIASPSELRLAVKNTASKVGVPVEQREAAYSTVMCHVCHVVSTTRDTFVTSIIQRCENCSAVWDQDFNACMNLLYPPPLDGSSQSEGGSGAKAAAASA